jgi:hypothetical protein
MMYLPDFENAITDYLENSGQNPEDWDVWSAAIQMRDMFPEAESIDDVPSGAFIEILKNHD